MEYIYVQLDQIVRPEYLMQTAAMASPTQRGSRKCYERWNAHRARLRAVNLLAARLL
jgi:hypothetical protein